MTDNSSALIEFDWRRGAIIAGAVTAFIAIFRPFGISISTATDLMAVFGFAPLNFAAIMLAHRISIGAAAHVIRTGAIIAANLIYAFFIGGGASWSTGIGVAFVSALVIGAVTMWNRERALHREVIELRQAATATRDDFITLCGEGEREILRLRATDLLFVAAKGNYAEVNHLKDGALTDTLLRASLKALAAQVADGALIPSHRSFLVNLGAAHRIIAAAGRMTIEFPGGATAPVSRRYRDDIRMAAAQNVSAVPPTRHSSQSD